MTKPAVTKLLPYAVALTLVSAAAATLTVATAGDKAGLKDPARHPDIVAISDESGMRKDAEVLPMPDKARDVIIVLPDGKHLVQRYYPSGYSVVFKPRTEDPIAARMYPEGELAQLDKSLIR